MDIQRETEVLAKVPLFSKLDQSKLKLLAFTSELQIFEDGEVVVREGDAADCTYVILDGEADIVVRTDGHEIIVGTLKDNQLLGELGVLTKSSRAATVRAKGRAMMLRIGGEMFLKLLAENPSVALDVIRQLSDKLVLAHRQYDELQQKLQRPQES